MIPKELLLTSSGDLDFSKGLQLTPDLKTYVKQRVLQRLRFFLGEWFLDQRLGVPYFEWVFVSNPDLPLLTSLFRKVILKTTGIGGLVSLALNFDRSTRVLSVSFVASLVDSTETLVISDEPFVLQLKEAA